jgi:hypothetical protein
VDPLADACTFMPAEIRTGPRHSGKHLADASPIAAPEHSGTCWPTPAPPTHTGLKQGR